MATKKKARAVSTKAERAVSTKAEPVREVIEPAELSSTEPLKLRKVRLAKPLEPGLAVVLGVPDHGRTLGTYEDRIRVIGWVGSGWASVELEDGRRFLLAIEWAQVER